ncbi:MAG TPA: hypothetical protein VNX68_07535, partial [Nitrosopumilaceae archaeon]|nr:hypothetical protein [Nitrosopumilaceae archaeon]
YHNNILWMLPEVSDEYTFVAFSNPSDQGAVDSAQNNDTDSQFNSKSDKESSTPLGIVKVSNGYSDSKNNPDEHKRLSTLNDRIKLSDVFDYSRLVNLSTINLDPVTGYPDPTQLNNGKGIFFTQNIDQGTIGNGITYTVYSHVTNDPEPRLAWGLFRPSLSLGDDRGRNQRIFLRRICADLENRMSKLENEKNNILSQVLGKAQSNENSLYIQMHHMFHQWGVLGFSMDNATVNTNKSSDGSNKAKDQQIASGTIALTLEKEYGTIIETIEDGKITKSRNVEDLPGTNTTGTITSSTGFRYDFPMERINPPPILTNVGHSIINIEPLYKPNANTTLLNIIQQLCTKNNFMFVPIPGNIDYTNITDIFKISTSSQPKIGNIFHVLFTPTPENRTKQNNGDSLSLSLPSPNGSLDAFEIKFGSPDNTIIKNIEVSTDESRPTAESILNLQRLVDKDNSNKAVTTDCSILSVMEGRSYKMKVDMIGNAQISPMQYFYVSKTPIFSGLYQVMNVTHSIKPNDMSTTLEGVKMRFDGSSMKGIGPITLESLKALMDTTGSNTVQPNALGTVSPIL